MNHPKDKLNRPLSDLRISVIDRCNFRCPYCMPEGEYNKHYSFLKQEQWLTYKEIERLTRIFIQCGVNKVRITGGEPLLRPNIDTLIHSLSNLKGVDDLALTTNGALLSQYAKQLKQAGLHRLTVSLDTLDSRTFKEMSGNKGRLEDVIQGIKDAEEAGFNKIKINIVIQKGVNDHAILDFIKYFRQTNHIIRFIEYMDVGNCNHWQSEYVVSSKEIYNIINEQFPLEAISPNYYGEVATRYRFKSGEGEVGFISSITQPFCQSCTRARLSTDGAVYTCLFSEEGIDLKTLLRSNATDQDILDKIADIWQNRSDRYSELRSKEPSQNTQNPRVEMFQIGG